VLVVSDGDNGLPLLLQAGDAGCAPTGSSMVQNEQWLLLASWRRAARTLQPPNAAASAAASGQGLKAVHLAQLRDRRRTQHINFVSQVQHTRMHHA
jgi:hypothetical protein